VCANSGVVALLGCADGALWRVDVTASGAASLSPLRRADGDATPGDAAAASAAAVPPPSPSVRGALGSASRAALGYLGLGGGGGGGGALRRGGVVCATWADAAADVARPPAAGGAHTLRALVLTEHTLEAWSLPRAAASAAGAASAQLLWCRAVSSPIRAALGAPAARVLSLCVEDDSREGAGGAGAGPSARIILLAASPGAPATLTLHASPLPRLDPSATPLAAHPLRLEGLPTRLSDDVAEAMGTSTMALRSGGGPAGALLLLSRGAVASASAAARPAAAAVLSRAGVLLAAHDADLVLDGGAGAADGIASGAWGAPEWRLLTSRGLLAWTPPREASRTDVASAQAALAPHDAPAFPRGGGGASHYVYASAIVPLPVAAEASGAPRLQQHAFADAVSRALRAYADARASSAPPAVASALPACAAPLHSLVVSGALTSSGGAEGSNAFVAAAVDIANTLPKQGGATLAAQLEDKRGRLGVYTEWLAACGAWALLSAPARAAIAAAGEQVCAAVELRRRYNAAAEAAAEAAAGGYGASAYNASATSAFLRGSGAASAAVAGAAALKAALEAAGAAATAEYTAASAAASTAGAGDVALPPPPPLCRDASELVFAAPAHIAHFFDAAAAALRAPAHTSGADGGPLARWAASGALCDALLVCFEGADAWRPDVPGPAAAAGADGAPPPLRWTAAPRARAALAAAAAAATRARGPLRSAGAAGAAADAARVLLNAAAALLDALAAAIAAAPSGSAEREALIAQHAADRDALLRHLLSAITADDADADASARFASAPPPYTIDDVADLAAAHRGYATLFDACEAGAADDADANARLARRMRQLRADPFTHAPPFAVFVFSRLRETRQLRRLLDGLPAEFAAELGAFLTDDPALLWMHAAAGGDPRAAAAALARVGGGEGEGAEAFADENDADDVEEACARKRARRLTALRLAKIARMAAGAGDDAPACVAADGAAELLRLEGIAAALVAAAALDARGGIEAPLGTPSPPFALSPGALVETLLRAGGGAAAPHAVGVFAAAGRSFRERHDALLRAVVRAAADATPDWAALAAVRAAQGDGAYENALAGTPLSAAVARALAPHQFIVDPPFFAAASLGAHAADVARSLADALLTAPPGVASARDAAGADALRDAAALGAAGGLFGSGGSEMEG
jgi:hypothetical protein